MQNTLIFTIIRFSFDLFIIYDITFCYGSFIIYRIYSLTLKIDRYLQIVQSIRRNQQHPNIDRRII